MAVKTRVLNLKSVLKKVEDIFSTDLKRSELMNLIGEFVLLRIQAETRKGNDLSKGSRQGSLSDATVRIRQDVASGKIREGSRFWFRPDGTFFSPPRSNLTATGQLLESLQAKITGALEVEISPSGTRDEGLGGGDIKDNKELAKDLASRGRTFIGLDPTGRKRVRKFILDEIRRFRKRRGF